MNISNIYYALLLFAILYVFSLLHVKLENSFRIEQPITIKKYMTWSLPFFKLGSLFLFFLGSIEAAVFPKRSLLMSLFGLLIFFVGVILRILAIKALGPQWTFHIALIKGHKVVSTGIYKIFKHPAYIGNIYICGIILTIGAIYTCYLSFVFIILFYYLRSRLENKLLSSIE